MVLAALTTALLAALLAPPVSGADDPPPPTPLRYLDPVFDDIVATYDVLYRSTEDHLGNPIDLRLDIYEPAGDTATERPMVVFMHGGWFAFGSKDGMGPVVRPYVERGYVAVAISYRLNPDNGWNTFSSIDEAMASPVFLQSVVAATLDAQAAVAWLRERSDELRVHPDAIVAAGHSAGATMSLLLAYGRDVNADGWAAHPSRVAAAMPWAGTVPTSIIQPGEPPIHVTHGTADTTVPYVAGTSVCDAALAIGNVCELLTLDGVGHSVTGLRETIIAAEADFLVRHVLDPLGIQPVPLPPEEPGPPSDPTFSDVPIGHPRHDDIECLAAAGVTTGYSDGTYRPNEPVSRQAMIAFLWRVNGQDEPAGPHTFVDVGPSHPFGTAIAWAGEAQIAAGYSDGTFRPTTPVSRQAASAFAFRTSGAGGPQYERDTGLPLDIDAGHPFLAPILWMLDEAHLDVDHQGRFLPTAAATRSDVASSLCALSTAG